MYVTVPNEHFERNVAPVTPVVRTRIPARALKSGSYLFHEGDDAKSVYQITSGVLRLTRVMENGRRQVIAFGFPGDVVGFPNGTTHHTDCDVLSDVQVIPHRREMLENGADDPVLHQQLLNAALREIAGMQDHFMMLGRKTAREKVASFLSVLADRIGQPLGAYTQVALPMSRSDIADFLGLTTETISRTLTELRKTQVIALENVHTVVVLAQDELLALAEGSDD